MTIETSRLTLIPATAELTELEITGNDLLGLALSAAVPANWPPEQLVDALPWFLQQLQAQPHLVGWLGWYGLCRRDGSQLPLLVASGGFLGLPMGGTAEVGYSVLPQFQGQGYATEMVAGLVHWALSQPAVQRVAAETGAENTASLRVLSKLGFIAMGPGRETGDIHFERHGLGE